MKKSFLLLTLVAVGCASQMTPRSAAPMAEPTPSAPMASTATPPAAAPCAANAALLDATLWAQTAAEHDALTIQTYATAHRMLDAALHDPFWTAALEQTAMPSSLPPAIILDADETILDNSAFEARMIRSGKIFTEEAWDAFVAEASARALAGSVEFLNDARNKGVTIFYVTNRRADQEAVTRKNLQDLGYPIEAGSDTVLMRGEIDAWKSSDKTPRRAFVASRYRVIMLFGDDLNDFVSANGKSMEERQQLLHDNADKWGTRWFILPNAMYGSWDRAAIGNPSGNPDDCAQYQMKLDKLR